MRLKIRCLVESSRSHRALEVLSRTKSWVVKTKGMDQDNGGVGVGVSVNNSGVSHTVVHAMTYKDDDVMNRLGNQAEPSLQPFVAGGRGRADLFTPQPLDARVF
ncbi:hypothetical protein SVAN01_03623 [Stagonosporopsis vannaccii]|nr:hypothetical protein SVAN01_03623 [Stagonosporopsis vannaccii]